jgi:Spy/CpxP family protein refolding chaperone
MTRSKLGIAVGAALTLLCAQPVMAGPSIAGPMGMGGGFGHGAMGMHGGGSPFLMLLKSANLTQAQQSQVQLILNSNKTQMEGLHQQLFGLHEQIAAKLLAPGAVSAADLRSLIQQASRIEADLNQNMADTALAIRNVLTPAQVKRLAEVHDKLHNLHKQVQQLMGTSGGEMGEPDKN